jgi:putative membrane protein
MKMKKVVYATALLALVVLNACSKDDNEVNDIDRTFTMQASLSNTVEVNAGTLAAQKATNAQVKQFAQNMIMEHQMAQADLKTLGANVGISIRDTVDPAHAAIMTQLTTMPAGRAFDSMYIHTQVADHTMTVANFQAEQNNGSHVDVKNYANTYLPHIQLHLQSADSIATAFFKR